MNRDELLQECFGYADPTGDLLFETVAGGDVVAHLGLSYRRVLVRPPTGPGPGITEASLTLTVAALSSLCVAPEHRGNGYARQLVLDAHARVARHPLIRFAAAFASDGRLLESLDYVRPDPERHPRFFVRSLDGSEWPVGRLDTRGEW